MSKAAKEQVTALLARAGIVVGGSMPWDIKVHDETFYHDVLARGRVGAGEAFMQCKWDCDDLARATALVLSGAADRSLRAAGAVGYFLRAQLINMQKGPRALDVALRHYNMGNDLFAVMLDPTMNYSGAYWREGVTTLSEAVLARNELSCRKVKLKRRQHIIDLGCGFGGFLEYAAKKCGVTGVGVTNSEEQAKFARERLKGLPVEIRVQDWRHATGEYDHVFSHGMLEHVGQKNFDDLFKKGYDLMKNGESFFLVQSIWSRERRWISDPWMHKYIFPWGYAPWINENPWCPVVPPRTLLGPFWGRQLLHPWDGHNLGASYGWTLRAWRENLSSRWHELGGKYGPVDGPAYRMMMYYLRTMEGAFFQGALILGQHLLSKNMYPSTGDYRRFKSWCNEKTKPVPWDNRFLYPGEKPRWPIWQDSDWVTQTG